MRRVRRRRRFLRPARSSPRRRHPPQPQHVRDAVRTLSRIDRHMPTAVRITLTPSIAGVRRVAQRGRVSAPGGSFCSHAASLVAATSRFQRIGVQVLAYGDFVLTSVFGLSGVTVGSTALTYLSRHAPRRTTLRPGTRPIQLVFTSGTRRARSNHTDFGPGGRRSPDAVDNFGNGFVYGFGLPQRRSPAGCPSLAALN